MGKGMSSDYLMGMGFPGGDENVELRVVLLHNFVNVLSTTELYTLTWLIWWILCEFYHNKMMGNQKRNGFLKSIFKIV